MIENIETTDENEEEADERSAEEIREHIRESDTHGCVEMWEQLSETRDE